MGWQPIQIVGVSTVCMCYLHFAPENPEDGEMYLLVPAHPGCPRQHRVAVLKTAYVTAVIPNVQNIFMYFWKKEPF